MLGITNIIWRSFDQPEIELLQSHIIIKDDYIPLKNARTDVNISTISRIFNQKDFINRLTKIKKKQPQNKPLLKKTYKDLFDVFLKSFVISCMIT